MRVLICGGRNYWDISAAEAFLTEWSGDLSITCVITGGARGADTIGHNWAIDKGFKTEIYIADWVAHQRKAGPLRNIQMLNEGKPDVVIAFPGGKGTEHMKAIARKAGVPVIEP